MIPKQLGELLQEKQEPFMLDIYLLEKGCSGRRFNSSPNFSCCSLNTKSVPKKVLSKRKKSFRNCSKAVKAVFGKIGFISNGEKVKRENEAKEKFRKRNKEDTGNDGNRIQTTQTRTDVLLPPDGPNHINHHPQHTSTNKATNQSKQLVFDCLKELIESNKWKLRREKNLLQLLNPAEICELLMKDLMVWSELSGNMSNITQLLSVDIQDYTREWRDFEPQKRDFSAEIGDAILEDISKEFVAEMICTRRPH